MGFDSVYLSIVVRPTEIGDVRYKSEIVGGAIATKDAVP